MIKSMTAYGRAESVKADLEFIVEIRSGNHRYREITLKLSQSLQPFEEMVRSLVNSRLKRGRVDVSIQLKDNGDKGLTLELNRPLVKTYIDIFNELNEELGSTEPIDISFLSQLKDVIIFKQCGVDPEILESGLKETVEKALISWETMRINEGKSLEKDFLERLEKINEYIDEVKQRSSLSTQEYRDKLIQRIKELVQAIELTEDRIIQEIAFMADKTDVTEELIRIRSHLSQFKKYMAQDEIVGRRLDFLLQEIHREVNTIGSKASDSFISQLVVEIKAELEKLREQTQNVE
jgi:uncharacterized protein (TIGR00255 family)